MEPEIKTEETEEKNEAINEDVNEDVHEDVHECQADKQKKKHRKPSKPVSTKRLLIYLLIKIAVILIVLWFVFAFVLGININHGNNMHPAINDGDLVVSLRLQKPYLNAVVLYRHGGETRTGRVVGLSGNVIDITENGELLINNALASEDIYYPTHKAENSDIQFPYTVEDGKAFILNDFREDTNDSRSFGAVDFEDIDGPLLIVLRRRGF